MTIAIRAAAAGDLDSVSTLLASAGLPVEDLAANLLALVAEADGNVIGGIGVERFAAVGLLRSLVVAPAARQGGVGARLVEALEADCRRSGCAELWLLTIDADAWFAARGYLRRERRDAPDAIRTTQEFSELCPDDAVLMSKSLT